MLTNKDILFYPNAKEAYRYARILKRPPGDFIELQRFQSPEDAALRNNPRSYPHYVTPDFLAENFKRVVCVDAYTRNGPVPEDYCNLTIRASEISKYPGIVFRFPWEYDGEEADPAIDGYVYLTADPRKDTHVIAYTISGRVWHGRQKSATEPVKHNFIGEQVYSWPKMPAGIHSLVMGEV